MATGDRPSRSPAASAKGGIVADVAAARRARTAAYVASRHASLLSHRCRRSRGSVSAPSPPLHRARRHCRRCRRAAPEPETAPVDARVNGRRRKRTKSQGTRSAGQARPPRSVAAEPAHHQRHAKRMPRAAPREGWGALLGQEAAASAAADAPRASDRRHKA